MSETKNKFTASNPKVNRAFNEDQFFKWSNGNLYRTSTHDMHIAHVSLDLTSTT